MSEHSVILVVPGGVEQARSRLVTALEKLDYHVLSEQPLQARRQARNFGVLSTNLLNYSMELTIGLQSYGVQTTRLTFFYKWQHAWGAIGDKPTLTREAEAIAALASLHARVTACAQCGTEGVAESRFCRSCGAVLAAAEPAELEVLRLTAAANAAGKANSFGVVMGFLAVACLLLAFFLPADATKLLLFSGLIGVLVWIATFIAGNRLMKTLNLKLEKKDELLSSDGQRVAELSPADARLLNQPLASVTENTTELLRPIEQPAPIPVRQRDDTSQ